MESHLMEENILELRNICKHFAGVTALDNVSLSVRRGEVHALMGENGAGKSTLIKVLTGIQKADAGEIYFDGKKCFFPNALSAQHAGISTIYQELNMIPYLTVSENIFLGRYPMRHGGIDWRKMHEKAQELVDTLDIEIDVKKPLNTYGTAKQQIISILRAISLKAKLIVMDEPTSSLDSNEVDILFNIIDKLKSDGVCMNWREILLALNDIGYQGAISFEPLPHRLTLDEIFGGALNPEELTQELGASMKYLKSIMQGIA